MTLTTHPKARQTVVFDLGGVLIDWNPRYLYRKLFTDEAQMEAFLQHICSPAWNEAQDRGRSWSEAVATLSEQHPEYSAYIAAYAQRWPEMLGGEIPGTVQVLEALAHQGTELHALTNWSAETFPIAQARFPFLQRFTHIVVSGQECLVKPELEIYRRLLTRIDRNAEDCIFIDDAARNIAAAETLGFDAILFQSPAQLRTALQARGLLEA